jgi:hypothetical protein
MPELINSDTLDLPQTESLSRLKTIFISGSAVNYANKNRYDARGFIHLLSKKLISEGFNIVNGSGTGIGSAVSNGGLEAIAENPNERSEDQLIMRPFPLFETGNKKLDEIWEDHRKKMISKAGIALFVFGNVYDEAQNVIPAQGVKREFEIALELGLLPIPIASTGYIAYQIFEEIIVAPEKYYKGNEWIIPLVTNLASDSHSNEFMIKIILEIIRRVNYV